MSKKNEKKSESKAPKNNPAPKKDKKAETPKAEEPKVESPKEEAQDEAPEIPATEPTEQGQLPGVEVPKGKDPLAPKPEKAAPKEKKPPKEFILKNELESMLIEGKSPGQMIEELTPKVAKACNKDEKWANSRIKQELGFFKNYCGPTTYKLDILDALLDELTGLVTITGVNKNSSERVQEILQEMKTFTGTPAVETPVK